MRFATNKYEPSLNDENISNMFMHLTNYAINKGNPMFQNAKDCSTDKGHKRSWTAVQKRLESEGNDMVLLQDKINDIIVKTMLTIQPDLIHNYRSC